LDLSIWEADEAKVYEYVNQGGNRHACLMYAIEYEDEPPEYCWRPSKIYYYFELFEDKKIVDLPIMNIFFKLSGWFIGPILTTDDF
jgi:hypothetical protein